MWVARTRGDAGARSVLDWWVNRFVHKRWRQDGNSQLIPLAEPDGDSAQLLTALRVQDPAAAKPLWQRFAPAIFRMLRRMLGPQASQASIDDVVQVVLLRVFDRARHLRPPTDLRQVVMRTTVRVARGELRRRRSRRLVSASPSGGAGDLRTHDLAGQDAEIVARFYRILDRLSPLDHIAFVLHYIEGLEVPEVATALEASPARTARRLRRSVDEVIEAIKRDPLLSHRARSHQPPVIPGRPL